MQGMSVLLSKINLSSSRAKLYIGDALFGMISRRNDTWHAIRIDGTPIAQMPHIIRGRAIHPDTGKEYGPIRETKIPLGVVIKAVREKLTAAEEVVPVPAPAIAL